MEGPTRYYTEVRYVYEQHIHWEDMDYMCLITSVNRIQDPTQDTVN